MKLFLIFLSGRVNFPFGRLFSIRNSFLSQVKSGTPCGLGMRLRGVFCCGVVEDSN